MARSERWRSKGGEETFQSRSREALHFAETARARQVRKRCRTFVLAPVIDARRPKPPQAAARGFPRRGRFGILLSRHPSIMPTLLLSTATPFDAGPGLWLAVPFLLLLALIATGPLAFPERWERLYPWFSIGLGAVTAGYYLLVLHRPEPLWNVVEEYVSFIALNGALFIIAGGIHVRVKGESTPAVNCAFLLVGAVASNVIGTTGASMLFIRPWIRMNKYRITAHHIVFFIFIVSNAGGCLTPIGDPPLFLGYLEGVPFWWALQHCWKPWLVVMAWLLGVFYLLDRRNFQRAPAAVREAQTQHEEWHFSGLRNTWFLLLALGAVFLPFGWREALLAGAALASWVATPADAHRANAFTFAPLTEVAWLFAGIFVTMVPALEWLQKHAAEIGLHRPRQFYWLSGALSGILDSAPTYLAFLAAAFGLGGLHLDEPGDMARFLAGHSPFLLAISTGAVFFGAVTYLGNGPNFIVKSIAQRLHVETPSFLGYILYYALPVLLPVLFFVSLLFTSS
jgi:Na+/H+ antiporter NhaD/arsenite permease-like protein